MIQAFGLFLETRITFGVYV